MVTAATRKDKELVKGVKLKRDKEEESAEAAGTALRKKKSVKR